MLLQCTCISVQCPTFYYVVPRDDMSTSGQHI